MKIFILFLIVVSPWIVNAQNVGIGTNVPHSSAALDIEDTTKGILIPRLTTNQRNAIQSPGEGLMVYQTDSSKGFYFFDGQQWIRVTNKISTDVLSSNSYRSIKIFDLPGTYSWTVPEGVNNVVAELWGAGGGPGGKGGNYTLYITSGPTSRVGGPGAAGGKGGYNKAKIKVSPGETYSVIVGGMGSQGANGSNGLNTTLATNGNTGGVGGNSSFHNIVAAGGFGGGGGGAAYQIAYNQITDGAPGVVPPDAPVLNYDYPYNSFQQIRSYIPVSYIPTYPTPNSNGSENGLVLLFLGD